MKRSRVIKLKFWLTTLLAVSFVGSFITQYPATHTLPQSLFNQSAETFANTLITDLDGDNLPDFASGRVENHHYQVEIQFSGNQQKLSLNLPNSDFGLSLFACDIDQDNDKDIVVKSAFSARPLAVWLSDGQGSFERDSNFSTPDSLNSDSSPTLEDHTRELPAASYYQRVQIPFDNLPVTFLPIKLETKDLLSLAVPQVTVKLLTDQSASRAPPTQQIFSA